MLLLTKVHALFRFPWFSLTSFCSLSQVGDHIAFSHLVFGFSWLWQYPSLPCFWWLWQFWGIPVMYFVDYISIWIFLLFFFSWFIGLWVWGQKLTKVKCHFHHVISKVTIWHQGINIIVHCWCWPSSDSICWFFHHKVTLLPLSTLYSLEGSQSTMYSPQWRGRNYVSPPTRYSTYINYLKFLWEICHFCYLFIYSSYIYVTVDLWIFILYFVL